jgi:hypothetical protein
MQIATFLFSAPDKLIFEIDNLKVTICGRDKNLKIRCFGAKMSQKNNLAICIFALPPFIKRLQHIMYF